MDIFKTESGFRRCDFRDCNDETCSIQESSDTTEPKLWLGCNSGLHHLGECLARMHLTQKHVDALLPLLHHFVDTGELPDAAFTPWRGFLVGSTATEGGSDE